MLAPVIVLTAAAVGTLMLVGTDGRTLPASGFDQDTADQINLLNNVVVGMIVLFAAVVVVNAFAAVVAHRKAELHRLWLLGATPRQVEASVLAEAGVVAGVGVLLGLVASLATIVPFGIARHEGLVPDGDLWLPPLVVAGVVALTLLAARSAVRRTARSSIGGGPMTDWSAMASPHALLLPIRSVSPAPVDERGLVDRLRLDAVGAGGLPALRPGPGAVRPEHPVGGPRAARHRSGRSRTSSSPRPRG